MIDSLAIKQFKSVRKLRIECKPINIFIGEPNTGKSNLLEALSLLSWRGHGGDIKNYVRFSGLQDLFSDNQLDENLEIIVKNKHQLNLSIKFAGDFFHMESKINNSMVIHKGQTATLLDYSGEFKNPFAALVNFSHFRYFKFTDQLTFTKIFSSYLLPPDGSNLFALLMGNKRITDTMNSYLKNLGLQLLLKPNERTLELLKQKDDFFIGSPLVSISEPLRRLLFFSAAIESCTDSILALDDPGRVGFPSYARHLGEKIAENKSNQYFISTHNPYFLISIMEKAPKESVNVFNTYLKNYQTKVELLNERQVGKLLDSGFFFGLPSLFEDERENEREKEG